MSSRAKTRDPESPLSSRAKTRDPESPLSSRAEIRDPEAKKDQLDPGSRIDLAPLGLPG